LRFAISRYPVAMQTLLDANQIAATVRQLADHLLADPTLRVTADNPLALIGIRSRGELLAQRLAAEILKRSIVPFTCIDVGALDITMYRDDLDSRRALLIPQGTEMNFRLDNRAVVLVDDVMETGRTIRAALDAIVDFGRPRLIRLAVLIDRRRHEFPIVADYAGNTVADADPHHRVIVHLQPTDPIDAVYLARQEERP
jgi:pyrimidine operon attenuation protein/uracil phosphoribosyltransferase